jgi:hypothetical protein
LLSLAVSACTTTTTTTDNKSNYQELTKGTSDKKKYEAIVSKIGQGVDLDKYITFEHFSSLITGSKKYNIPCTEILSQVDNICAENSDYYLVDALKIGLQR